MEKFWFSWFSMNFSTLAEDEDEDDEKVIPKTASGGHGQKYVPYSLWDNPCK